MYLANYWTWTRQSLYGPHFVDSFLTYVSSASMKMNTSAKPLATLCWWAVWYTYLANHWKLISRSLFGPHLVASFLAHVSSNLMKMNVSAPLRATLYWRVVCYMYLAKHWTWTSQSLFGAHCLDSFLTSVSSDSMKTNASAPLRPLFVDELFDTRIQQITESQ
jgi:hypothetical protein